MQVEVARGEHEGEYGGTPQHSAALRTQPLGRTVSELDHSDAGDGSSRNNGDE